MRELRLLKEETNSENSRTTSSGAVKRRNSEPASLTDRERKVGKDYSTEKLYRLRCVFLLCVQVCERILLELFSSRDTVSFQTPVDKDVRILNPLRILFSIIYNMYVSVRS